MKDFKINFALSDSEYLTAVRLVVGAICSANEVDIDATEDFKVCVTECCIILNNCGNDLAEITFNTHDGLCAEVKGMGGNLKEGDNDFSLALISALVSSCEIEKEGQAITKVVLKL
jgi:hypothetical protein